MVYIQLRNSTQGFDKARIKQLSFFDTNGKPGSDKGLGFRYQVYKKIGNEYLEQYQEHVNIKDQDTIESVLKSSGDKISAFDIVCKQLLQHLINEKILLGTIEKE